MTLLVWVAWGVGVLVVLAIVLILTLAMLLGGGLLWHSLKPWWH